MSQLRQVLPLKLSGVRHFTKLCPAYGTLSLSLLGKNTSRAEAFVGSCFVIAANQSHLLGSVGINISPKTDYLELNTKLAAVAGPGAAALCVVTPTPL